MKALFAILITLIAMLTVSLAIRISQIEYIDPVPPSSMPSTPKIEPRGPEDLDILLRTVATSKGLSHEQIEQMRTVIGGPGDGYTGYCKNGESSWNPDAIGDGGTSYGLAQIHLPAHPHITKEQALDPEFAIEFMADGFKNGQEKMWTCYRVLFT